MRSILRRAGTVATAAILGLVAVPAAAATAAPASGSALPMTQASTAGPVAAGLSITPSVTTVGGTVTVVATATNTTNAPVGASLGIENPSLVPIVGLTRTCMTRNLTRLVYCGIQSLAPGATVNITLTLSPKTAGTFNFTVYARVTYTSNDTYAYGTLTAS